MVMTTGPMNIHDVGAQVRNTEKHAALYHTVRTAQSPPDPLIIKEKAIYTATTATRKEKKKKS